MGAQKKICLTAALLFCYVLITLSLEAEKRTKSSFQSLVKKKSGAVQSNSSHITADNKRQRTQAQRNKVKKNKMVSGGAGSDISTRTGSDVSCTSLGGICQPTRFICQGRYLNDKCPGGQTHQCCVPAGAWSVLCAGHYNNRVRACDEYGCGAFNSRRGAKLHKAVDIVCDDFGVVQAPFSGVLSGPVSHVDPSGIHYHGVKLFSQVHCVKLLNIRPYRYMGSVTRGGAVGYTLPLQDRFSGITSHIKLQMCDGSDPTVFL